MNIKKLLPAIFTGVSVLSTVAAVVFATDDAFKAQEILDDHRLELDPSGETDLTVGEKVVDYAKGYWRTGIFLGISIASNLASFILQRHNYKSLLASTAALAGTFARYKDKVREVIGVEKERFISQQVRKEIKEQDNDTSLVWFQEPASGTFFQMTWHDYYDSVSEINHQINAGRGYVEIGEIFPRVAKLAPITSKLTWEIDRLYEGSGMPWVEVWTEVKNRKGSEENPIDFNFNEGRETYVIHYGAWPEAPEYVWPKD